MKLHMYMVGIMYSLLSFDAPCRSCVCFALSACLLGLGRCVSVCLLRPAADERVLADPEPVAFVASLDDSSVGIGLRVWCATGDYLGLGWDLTEKVKARFDDVGISIPFPQREVTQRAA